MGSDRRVLWALLVIALLTMIWRLLVLSDFGWVYTGTDDTVIWLVARDYAHGLFREPYMYGQDYNPMVDALLAAPFIRLGAEAFHVLPIIATLVGLFPYWSLALFHQRHESSVAAVLFAVMPLLLPATWDLTTTLTRGYTHGLMLISLVPWVLAGPPTFMRSLCASVVTCVAILCNPNALVIAVFIHLPVLAERFRKPSHWIASVLGTAPALSYWLFGKWFFASQPQNIVHTIDRAELYFSWSRFTLALGQLDMHFKGLMPLWWPNGWLAFPVLVVIILLLWRKDQRVEAVALGLASTLMIFALGTVKGHNGCASSFFPASRLYLSIPLLLAGGTALLFPKGLIKTKGIAAALCLALLCTVAKGVLLEETIQRELAQQACALAPVRPLADVFNRCAAMRTAAKETGAELIAPLKWPLMRTDPNLHFQAYVDCYACSYLIDDVPVYGPGYDRRSWVRDEWGTRPAPRTLFVNGNPEGWYHAMRNIRGSQDRSTNGLLLHTLPPDPRPVTELSVLLGVDDDPAR